MEKIKDQWKPEDFFPGLDLTDKVAVKEAFRNRIGKADEPDGFGWLLRKNLLDSGDKKLSDADFMNLGKTDEENEMFGEIWMELRDEIRKAESGE